MTLLAILAWTAVIGVGWAHIYRERLFRAFITWLTRDFERPHDSSVKHFADDGVEAAGITHNGADTR